jgi:hypothetical protein
MEAKRFSIGQLNASIDEFDKIEPMTPEARETFREEVVPCTKRLLQDALDRDHVDTVDLLSKLWSAWCVFASRNGHLPAEEVGNPMQREELPPKEPNWRP